MRIVIITWVVTVLIGFGLYFGYTRLPRAWREKVAGWKTNTVGAIVAFAPDGINLLSHIQIMSEYWTPSETVNFAMKFVGILIIVLRYVTTFEQKEGDE